MYDRKSNLVFGFHGLDESIGRSIIAGEINLEPSNNDYDWLGTGIYFWENSLTRAKQWAQDQSRRNGSSVKSPFAIGAVLDLGYCLDLLDQKWLNYIKDSYKYLKEDLEREGLLLPQNRPFGKADIDFKNRELDCAVIRYAVAMAEQEAEQGNGVKFDSVRAAFWEGEEPYPNAGFKKFTHIQIAVINPECIKGVFLPKSL